MKLKCLFVALLLSLVLSAAAHKFDDKYLSYAWDNALSQTPPPLAPVRPIAEFEPASHVIIRYPLGIPVSLVAQFTQEDNVICIVANSSQENSAANSFMNAGADMSKVSFVHAATDSYWTRDYTPWYIFDGNGDYGVVDFNYNRPRPNDNQFPLHFANHFELPYYMMNIYQTGGNYMTDGVNTAAQTTIAYTENGNNQSYVNSAMHSYLGIENYHVVPDPNNTYIDHIDCWGKFLSVDKILIRSVQQSHPQYAAIEATAAYFAAQNCAWGYPYKVFRVYTPSNQPYSNSLILNKRVFVPLTNSAQDASALDVYRAAMPGYEVIGVYGTYYTPWEATDALHCRTHEVPDAGMLHIAHQPLFGNQLPTRNFEITADITAHSGAELIADSLYVRYKINSGQWQFSGMQASNPVRYTTNLGSFSPGDTLRYYIHASDMSGRNLDHPMFGALDPHLFIIEGDATAPFMAHNPIDYIGNEPITFVLLATDDSGIDEAAISFRIDEHQSVTHSMAEAGEGLYLYLYEPDFVQGNSVFNYRFVARDNLGNIGYLPSADGWYSVDIDLPNSVAQLTPQLSDVLRVYPNPSQRGEKIHIVYQVAENAELKLEVYNLKGQKVYQQYALGQSQAEIQWDAVDKNGQRLSSGLYFVRLDMGAKSYNRKLIITN